jgi:hypothetical protein
LGTLSDFASGFRGLHGLGSTTRLSA